MLSRLQRTHERIEDVAEGGRLNHTGLVQQLDHVNDVFANVALSDPGGQGRASLIT